MDKLATFAGTAAPAVCQQGQQAQFAAIQLTVGYNQALADTLTVLQAALPVLGWYIPDLRGTSTAGQNRRGCPAEWPSAGMFARNWL